MDDVTTEGSFDLIRKLRGSLMHLAYSFNMLSMGFCTTGHWQTPGRLMQESDGCIVCIGSSMVYALIFSFALFLSSPKITWENQGYGVIMRIIL